MLTDTEFEHMVREAGYRPTLLQLGWMRWAFDQGVELASQKAYLDSLKGEIPAGQASPL